VVNRQQLLTELATLADRSVPRRKVTQIETLGTIAARGAQAAQFRDCRCRENPAAIPMPTIARRATPLGRPSAAKRLPRGCNSHFASLRLEHVLPVATEALRDQQRDQLQQAEPLA